MLVMDHLRVDLGRIDRFTFEGLKRQGRVRVHARVDGPDRSVYL